MFVVSSKEPSFYQSYMLRPSFACERTIIASHLTHMYSVIVLRKSCSLGRKTTNEASCQYGSASTDFPLRLGSALQHLIIANPAARRMFNCSSIVIKKKTMHAARAVLRISSARRRSWLPLSRSYTFAELGELALHNATGLTSLGTENVTTSGRCMWWCVQVKRYCNAFRIWIADFVQS